MQLKKNNNLFLKTKAVIITTLMITVALTALTTNFIPIAETNSVSLDDNHLIYTISFTPPTLSEYTLNDETYSKIHMANTMNIGSKPGTPIFPVYPLQPGPGTIGIGVFQVLVIHAPG